MAVFNKDNGKRVLYCSNCNRVYIYDPNHLDSCKVCYKPLYNTGYSGNKWHDLDQYEQYQLKIEMV